MDGAFFKRFRRETLYSEEYSEEMHRRGWWESMGVGDYLDLRADEHGEETAIRYEDEALTWEELRAVADRVAAGFREYGIEPGARVSMQIPNRIEWHITRLGIHRAGAIASTMMPRFREKEMTHIIQTVEPTAYVGVAGYKDYDHIETALALRTSVDSLEHVFSIGATAPSESVSYEELRGTSSTGFTPERIHPDYPDRLKTSGGTTGLPKLIYYSHNVRAQGQREVLTRFGITAHDEVLALAPFPHGISTPLGFTGLLLSGATCIIGNPSRSPSGLLDQIAECEPSVITITPTQLNKIKGTGEVDDSALNSLRLISYSGEPLSRDTASYFEEHGPKLVTYYGLGVGGAPFISCPGDPPEVRHASAGKPVIPGEVRIVDETGSELPSGKTGEVIWKGPWLALGYYDNSEATNAAFKVEDDGIWIYTDDAGRMDEAGNLTIEGRLDDMIIRGGENIFPAHIEDVLVSHDAVLEAAIIGVPDPEYGQRACAFVRATQEVSLPEIQEVMDEAGLAKFKWPERIEVRDDFPMTAAGKVDKKRLRKDIESKYAHKNNSS